MKIEVISATKSKNPPHNFVIGRTVYDCETKEQFLDMFNQKIQELCFLQELFAIPGKPTNPINIVWREIE